MFNYDPGTPSSYVVFVHSPGEGSSEESNIPIAACVFVRSPDEGSAELKRECDIESIYEVCSKSIES